LKNEKERIHKAFTDKTTQLANSEVELRNKTQKLDRETEKIALYEKHI